MGDVNINILNASDNYVNDYLSGMAQLGYVSYINSPTRFESGTCLDHMFVCQRLRANNFRIGSYILDTHITDHAPTMLNINLDMLSNNTTQNIPIILNKTRFDLQKFKQLLEMQDWSGVVNIQESDEATKVFIDIYQDLITKSKIVYTIKLRKNCKRKKWITNGIVTSIKYRDKLKRRLLKNMMQI